MSDEKVTLKPWSKIPCDLCGNEYQATRTESKTCLAEELICGECASHETGYAEGLEAGSRCSTCAGGTDNHVSGLPCICGGVGTQEAEIVAYHLLVDRMWETLDFYATPETYHACMFMFDSPTGGFDQDFNEDHGHPGYDRPMPGKLARLVLKEGQAGSQARRDRKFVRMPWMDEAIKRRRESPVLNLIAALVDRQVSAFDRWPAIKHLCRMYVMQDQNPRTPCHDSSVGGAGKSPTPSADTSNVVTAKTLREVVTSALEEDQEGDVVDVVVKALSTWRPVDSIETPQGAGGQQIEVGLAEYKDLQAQSHELADMKKQLQEMIQGTDHSQETRIGTFSQRMGEWPWGGQIVHYLTIQTGLASCGFDSNRVPKHWPPGHTWVTFEDPKGVTCKKCIEQLGEEVRKIAPAVHILKNGKSCCGFDPLARVPEDWPEGHTWVPFDNPRGVTCENCIAWKRLKGE